MFSYATVFCPDVYYLYVRKAFGVKKNKSKIFQTWGAKEVFTDCKNGIQLMAYHHHLCCSTVKTLPLCSHNEYVHSSLG